MRFFSALLLLGVTFTLTHAVNLLNYPPYGRLQAIADPHENEAVFRQMERADEERRHETLAAAYRRRRSISAIRERMARNLITLVSATPQTGEDRAAYIVLKREAFYQIIKLKEERLDDRTAQSKDILNAHGIEPTHGGPVVTLRWRDFTWPKTEDQRALADLIQSA